MREEVLNKAISDFNQKIPYRIPRALPICIKLNAWNVKKVYPYFERKDESEKSYLRQFTLILGCIQRIFVRLIKSQILQPAKEAEIKKKQEKDDTINKPPSKSVVNKKKRAKQPLSHDKDDYSQTEILFEIVNKMYSKPISARGDPIIQASRGFGVWLEEMQLENVFDQVDFPRFTSSLSQHNE